MSKASRRTGKRVSASARTAASARTPVRTVPPPFLSGWKSPAALALCAIVAFGAALRLPHLGHDLPWLLEEAIPFRGALASWMSAGHPDWNPHRFHYPSLVYDLHLIIQIALAGFGRVAGWWASDADFLMSYVADPTRMALAGRTIHLIADLATIVAVGRAGERLKPGTGLIAALVVAGSTSLIRTSRLIYTDTVLAALAAWCIERVIDYAQRGGAGRRWSAAVLAGLAAGAKYPGVVLLVPLAVEIVRRERAHSVRLVLACIGIAATVFLITTPFAIFDAGTFLRDVGFVGRMATAGHLGDYDRPGFGYQSGNLLANLGIAGIAALAAALLAIVLRRGNAGAVVPVALAFLLFAAPIAIAKIEVERYVVPLIPFAALLAAWGALSWAAAMPTLKGLTAVGVGLAVALPVALAGISAGRAGAGSTQVEALHWCERNLTTHDLVVSEIYGPPLLTRTEATRLEEYSLFQKASPAVQQRCRARRWYAGVLLPIATVGRVGNPVRDPAGRIETLEVAPQAAEIDRAFYDPRLLAGVDYVITSDAVRGRFAADSARFPAPNRFYRLLDRSAEVAARFRSNPAIDGPEIVVYRLGKGVRDEIAPLGPLDSMWWTDAIPDSYRVRAQSRMTGTPSGLVPAADANGKPAAWVSSLTPLFADRFEAFATSMAIEHQQGGRPALAWPFACAILDHDPANLGAWSMLGWCAEQLGRWPQALPRLERGMAAIQRSGAVPQDARAMLQQARVRAGESNAAKSEVTR
jgi:hypothetical protein